MNTKIIKIIIAVSFFVSILMYSDLAKAEINFFNPDEADWTRTDTQIEIVWAVAQLIDLGTTLDIKNHSDIREMNPLLGEHPSDELLYVTFISGLILHPIVSYLLPKHLVVFGCDIQPRKNWQALTLGISGSCASSNINIGLNLSF